MFVANPQGDVRRQLVMFFDQTRKKYDQDPQLMVCVLPNIGSALYAAIKRTSDTELGIPTQCVQVTHTRLAKVQVGVATSCVIWKTHHS